MLSLMLLELTLEEIVADLPHDAGAAVVLLLLLGLVAVVWHGSRAGPSTRGPRPSGEPPAARQPGPVRTPAPDPGPEPVSFTPEALSTAPDVRRTHPEVR